MKALRQSATRIVFILMAVAVCIMTYIGKIEAKDFVLLAGMTFQFYYMKKSSEKVTS